MRLLIPSPIFVVIVVSALVAAEVNRRILPQSAPERTVIAASAHAKPTETTRLETSLRPLPDLTEDQRTALQDHPLFSSTRSPAVYVEPIMEEPDPYPEPVYEEPEAFVAPEPEPVEPAPVFEPDPPDFAYLGFISSDNGARALIADRQSNQERWVSVNDMLNNWRVATISQSEVTFEQDGFEFAVKMIR